MALKKKGHPKFNIPNYGTKSRSRVKARWRKQRGETNKKRIKFAFAGAEPTIGYRNPESIRGVRASGNRLLVVHNANELREMVRNPDISGYDFTIAAGVSKRKRQDIQKVADEAKVRITNGVRI
ncbi:MAG: eL32 family ribosomal protein [Candidatus Marsarchaeota archaeon]|nr:eL32 family ribosomal protein [Candidatus Marsarchaeota archaeon]